MSDPCVKLFTDNETPYSNSPGVFSNRENPSTDKISPYSSRPAVFSDRVNPFTKLPGITTDKISPYSDEPKVFTILNMFIDSLSPYSPICVARLLLESFRFQDGIAFTFMDGQSFEFN